jgi:hypothetical protein
MSEKRNGLLSKLSGLLRSTSYRSKSVPAQSLSKKIQQEQKQKREKQLADKEQKQKREKQLADKEQQQKREKQLADKAQQQKKSQTKKNEVLAELAKLPDVNGIEVKWRVANCPYKIKGRYGKPSRVVGRQGQKIIFITRFFRYYLSAQLKKAGVSDDVLSGLKQYSESKDHNVVYITV